MEAKYTTFLLPLLPATRYRSGLHETAKFPRHLRAASDRLLLPVGVALPRGVDRSTPAVALYRTTVRPMTRTGQHIEVLNFELPETNHHLKRNPKVSI